MAGNKLTKHKGNGLTTETVFPTNPGDNKHFLAHNLQIASLPPIVRQHPDEVSERTNLYFSLCMQNDMKPSIAGYALALGCSRVELFRIETGETKSVPIESRNIIIKAKQIINAELEDYMESGKINPVSGIFLMKNNLGYKDQSDLLVKPDVQTPSREMLIAQAEELPED